MHKPRKNGECNLEVVVKDGVVSTEIAHGEEMSHIHNVGPGDPLLAKQKHHHRKAFEYISKALKIDEENEGKNASFKNGEKSFKLRILYFTISFSGSLACMKLLTIKQHLYT